MVEDAEQKLFRLREMPYGTARFAATELLLREIENDGPEELLPVAILDAVDACEFGAPSPHVFSLFAKAVRLWDTRPELFDEVDTRNLFWVYKWLASDLNAYPQISLAQGRAFLDEMRQRMSLAGYSEVAVNFAEYRWADSLGHEQEAFAWREKWRALPSDELDCAVCRHSEQLGYLARQQHFAQAVELGPAVGEYCNQEPSGSYRVLTRAYLELGDGVRAGKCLLRSLATYNDQFAPAHLGEHFSLLAQGDQLERALQLLRDRGKRALLGEGEPLGQYYFLLELVRGLSAHAAHAADFATRISQGATVGELLSWALEQIAPLVAAFDARAHNSYRAQQLEEARAATVLAEMDLTVSVDFKPDFSGFASDVADDPAEQEEAHGNDVDAATPEQLYRLADDALGQNRFAQAAQLYKRASLAFEDAGELHAAGEALADAAQCAALIFEYTDSYESFSKAWELLVAGDAEVDVLLAVLQAWGAVAEELSQVSSLVPALHHVAAQLPADLAEANYDHARVLDLHARICAATAEYSEALAAAKAAGEEFAQLQLFSEAAQAYALSAHVLSDQQDVDAAIEAFKMTLQALVAVGDREEHARTINALLEMLLRAGRTQEYEEIAAQIVG